MCRSDVDVLRVYRNINIESCVNSNIISIADCAFNTLPKTLV